MKTLVLAMAAVALSAFVAPHTGAAQEATEQFIPVGRSPGLSGIQTVIGNVEAVDAEAATVTVEGVPPVRITERTRIWLDRSQIGETSTVGTLEDVQVGRRIEVKFVDNEAREEADWIKVVIPA